MTSPIRALSDHAFAELVEAEPSIRARSGKPIETLRLSGEEVWKENAALAQGILDELAATEPLDEDDRLTAGHLEHVLGLYTHRADHQDAGFTVTPYQTYDLKMMLSYVFGAFTGTPSARLDLVAEYRDGVRHLQSRLERQRDLGILVPRPALEGVRRSLVATKETAATALPGSASGDVRDNPVFGEVAAAFDALVEYLGDDYEAAAPDDVCLSNQPGGEAYYRSLVHDNTASTLTPEQLHDLGLEQVAALAEQMAELRSTMGFHGTEAEFHAALAVDPRVHATTPDEVNDLFLRHMAALEPRIGDFFSVLPQAPYGVARVDPAYEAGMTYGYYEQPTAADPVGRYRWNGSDLENKSLLTYAALIFHELAPGHHFHLARQAENLALPAMRREGFLGAFNEGWAEYASGLGWEMGLYADPLDAYGRLVHERFTAQRLVVDTGLNLHGWSLERAAAYMKANTTDSDAQIASEVLRYATDLPAQALAYRAGYLELMRLRAKAETALGARFDVRDFHEHVLGPGALPFPVIDASIDRWASRATSEHDLAAR